MFMKKKLFVGHFLISVYKLFKYNVYEKKTVCWTFLIIVYKFFE